MSSDVVPERDQLLVHELLGTRRDGIPSGIRGGELRDDRVDIQRALKIYLLLHDASRGVPFRGRFLRRCRCGRGDDENRGNQGDSVHKAAKVKRVGPSVSGCRGRRRPARSAASPCEPTPPRAGG
jgi:hypothetical protein